MTPAQREQIEHKLAASSSAVTRLIESHSPEQLSYNVLSAFRILETHERRHLRQAEAAVASS